MSINPDKIDDKSNNSNDASEEKSEASVDKTGGSNASSVSQNKSGESNKSSQNSRAEAKSRLYKPTAASQARAKAAGTAIKKPLLPKASTAKPSKTVKKGPIKPATQHTSDVSQFPTQTKARVTNDKGRGERSTPVNSTMVAKQVVSTPTEDTDMTLGAWDASVIPTVSRTRASLMDDTVADLGAQIDEHVAALEALGALQSNDCDETQTAAPILRLHNPRSDVTLKKKTTPPMAAKLAAPKTKKFQTTAKPKQQRPPVGKMSATVAKAPAKAEIKRHSQDDTSDEEIITDEMMKMTYYRYIQSEFIKMKSQEVYERTKSECDKQVFQAWSLLEQERMKYNNKMKELEKLKTIDAMQQSLKVVKEKLKPVLDAMEGFEYKFRMTALGLEAVKHNLAVQGVSIPDQQVARAEMDGLSKLFSKFLEDTDGLDMAVGEGGEKVHAMAAEYEKLAENFSDVLRLSEDCKKLLNVAEQLAMKEASLKISMSQLERKEKKQSAM